MNIVVDRNIRAAQATFGQHGRIEFRDGRTLRHQDLLAADALLIRTTTRVDQALLHDTRVRFVGSTSIGTDHLDTQWLERQGITWAHAPGCNADSAAQYSVAMAWLACRRLGRRLPALTAGVIGFGNVGSRVAALLRGLGLAVVANDPPLAEAGVSGLVPLGEALEQDLVFLHVPLTRSGPHPTHRLIGAERLAGMRDGGLIVNTARGDVIDGAALQRALASGRVHAALDVWPGEPLIDAELLKAVTVATPHVAGYSDDGKRKGTWMVYEAFCTWAGLRPVEPPDPLPTPPPLRILPGESAADRALEAACFVARHDAALRALAEASADQRATGFDRLRRNYPPRRDFGAWTVECPDLESQRLCLKLGFAAVLAA